MGWLLVIDQFNYRIGEPKLGIGILSFRSYPWIPDQCVISPENKGHGIKQKQLFLHAAKVGNSTAGAVY
jgi:hypothetical protein